MKKGDVMHETAILSNNKDIVIFSYKDIVIRYKGPYSLEYFSEVKKYDNGYMEVMCKFSHNTALIEDYIDMEDIVTNLYMDTEFLKKIKEVRCEHA